MSRGASAVLGCEVSAELVPLLRWERDRQALPPDPRLLQLPTGALLLTNASDSDAGLYRCALDTGGAPKYSDEAELRVLPGTAAAAACRARPGLRGLGSSGMELETLTGCLCMFNGSAFGENSFKSHQ